MRLIDADALLNDISDLKKSPWFHENYFDHKNIRKEAIEIVEQLCIDKAPTIDAVPQWIPCEERLPENESEVLVTDNNGHIRHAFYDAKRDWFGTYEESMTIRAIAWMPLPEPYEGESDE